MLPRSNLSVFTRPTDKAWLICSRDRMATYCVGVDLGGTRIKAVAVSRQGEVLGRETRASHDGHSSISGCAETICNLIAGFESAQGEAAISVGLATPGLIAKDSRSVASCPGKLVGIEGLDWSSALGRKQTVLLLNDAHAALVGEHWIGAARGFQNAILMTLGTGVG